MNRVARLRSMLNSRGRGLEIGPSHNPAMPKAEGFQVEVFDYLDADGLRRKYAAAGVDVSRVEDVDFIGDGRPIDEVIGAEGCYDWIVASHVIEHVPDLLGFLRSCERLLTPRGRLVLAVPDKRCCFDVLRPLSTPGQVLQAHLDRRTKPEPGVIFDDLAFARLRGGRTGWSLDDRTSTAAARSVSDSWDFVDAAQATPSYHDVHCWTFVPSSFKLIVGAMFLGAQTSLSIRSLHVEDGEFFTALSGEGPVEAFDLGDLAVAAALEDRAIPLA